jgi:hypothetical protein
MDLSNKRGRISIFQKRPDLMKEWNSNRNIGIDPYILSYGSHRFVWWICSEGHEWQAPPNRRTNNNSGCPFCSGANVSDINALGSKYPDLLLEWDYRSNLDVDPCKISYSCNTKYWWKCKEGHRWFISPNQRTGHTKIRGCPTCYSLSASRKNPITKTNPGLLEEWDYLKNKTNPENVSRGSHSIVWWRCKVCDYSWKTAVSTRASNGRGCPACSGLVVTFANSLQNNAPAPLLREWSDKNEMVPADVSFASGKKVWWKCAECSYEWKALISNRNSKRDPSGCPLCSKGGVSKRSKEWLDALLVTNREKLIRVGGKRFVVDGFDPDSDTVYEFLGDIWHGNPEVYSPDDINPMNKKKYKDLYNKTMSRISLLEEAGYTVVYIWEKDFVEYFRNQKSEGMEL